MPRPRRALPAGLTALVTAGLAVAGGLGLAGCGPRPIAARPGQIVAIGAENEYANVIAQVGGRYVAVGAIERNPNTDPHTFEASATVAREIAQARLIVQNGLGYDTYMNRLEAGSPQPRRVVIDVQHLLGVPASEPNPHLWYRTTTMPAVAAAVAGALSRMMPTHRAYFAANVQRFDASLRPWFRALATVRAAEPRLPVAVSEPVGDYLLQAAGARILTPFTLQADVMNGVDPAPQDISRQEELLRSREVRVFLYNQQVTDPLTATFLATARAAGVPVVGVYETMPPGYNYGAWMLAETRALLAAARSGRSTTVLR
jgi:zinc/manganese transport system substrate-binding protein